MIPLGQKVKYKGKVYRVVGSTNAPSYSLERKGKRVKVIGKDVKEIKLVKE